MASRPLQPHRHGRGRVRIKVPQAGRRRGAAEEERGEDTGEQRKQEQLVQGGGESRGRILVTRIIIKISSLFPFFIVFLWSNPTYFIMYTHIQLKWSNPRSFFTRSTTGLT